MPRTLSQNPPPQPTPSQNHQHYHKIPWRLSPYALCGSINILNKFRSFALSSKKKKQKTEETSLKKRECSQISLLHPVVYDFCGLMRAGEMVSIMNLAAPTPPHPHTSEASARYIISYYLKRYKLLLIYIEFNIRAKRNERKG